MNKKILALVIGATLVTGMGGYGTVAYFTDKSSASSEINITMGTLDVNSEWKDSSWRLRPGNTEATITEGSFTNVKPGDYFYRDVKVKNVGTLDSNTTITLKNGFNNPNITTSVQLLSGDNILKVSETQFVSPFMKSEQEYIFRVKININKDAKAGDIPANINNIAASEFIVVDSEQLKH